MARFALCLLTMMALGCQGQQLTQGDRDYAVSAMHATRKLFLDTVAGMSAKQAKWKPSAEVWSVLEVAEHIALSDDLIPQMAVKAMQGPAAPEKRKANTRAEDAKILAMVASREQKAKASGAFVPSGKFKDLAAVTAAFKASRDRNIAYVRETKDELRTHFAEGPVGAMDALQVYLLMAGHTERHVKQMREVMGMAGFPKK